MKELLIETLETICPGNVFLQGTFAEEEAYPESFITIWTDDTDDNSHYDNDVHSIDWYFTVIFYSSDPSQIGTIPGQITAALKEKGFIPQGKGFDIPSDRPSHTGWTMEFVITEVIDD